MENASRTERLLPVAGPVFTGLMVLAAVVFPMPPGGDDVPGKQPAWLAGHTDAIVAQGYVRALAALAFVALALSIAATVRREGGSRLAASSALVGGAATGLLLLLAQGASIGSALAAKDGTGDAVVRGLGYVSDALLTVSSLPAVILFAAAGSAFLRFRLAPKWLAWVTLAGVPFALLDAVSYDGGPFESVGILGLAYFLLWSLAAGTSLATTRGVPEPAPAR